MSYFDKFPSIQYPYEGYLVDSAENKTITCVDLSVRYRIKPELFKQKYVFYDYTWKDHDRPDIVAKRYYGDVKYAWVVALSIQMWDVMNDLPQSEEEMAADLTAKYNVEYSELADILDHYEDELGQVIDHDTYTVLPETKRKWVSVLEQATIENDAKRKVKLVSKDLLSAITLDFEKQIEKLNG